jgi:hypothetical protein
MGYSRNRCDLLEMPLLVLVPQQELGSSLALGQQELG